MSELVEIDGVTKAYGPVLANDDVSLTVQAGEVVALLGPNGAGKTTLVHQLIGLVRSDRGTITIDNKNTEQHRLWARRCCSFQPQAPVAIEGLTPREAVSLAGQLRGATARRAAGRAEELFARLSLGEFVDRPVADTSGGIARLVMFCMATVAPGQVVVLDEPTNDVDPLRRRELWAIVADLRDQGCSVLLVTHNVSEAERVVDRVAIMNHGRILTVGTPAELASGRATVQVEVHATSEQARIPVPAGFGEPMRRGRRLSCRIRDDQIGQAARWCQLLRQEGTIDEFRLGPITLEDAYADTMTPTGAA